MKRRSQGFIYLLSLGVVILLTMASASLLIRGVAESSVSERFRNQAAAFQNAEAGVDQAALNLRTPTDANDDITNGTFPTGTFSIDVPPTSLGGQTWKVVTHGASAKYPTQPRNIEAVFGLTPKSVSQAGLFADQHLSISGSAISKSYDSRNGPYSDAVNTHNGDVGTNSTTSGGVTVGGSIFIDGQVLVGPGISNPLSVVTGYNPSFITGGTSPPSDTQDVVSQPVAFPMSAVTMPGGLTCSDYTIAGGNTLTLTSTGGPLGNGTYCYHDLTVQGNASLTANGRVKVYLTGDLIARGNSSVGVPSDPTAMVFFGSSTGSATLEEGTITGSTKFYGALYAPGATINISGSADVFGSIVARTINVTGSAAIYYDEALADCTGSMPPPTCGINQFYTTTIISWREL